MHIRALKVKAVLVVLFAAFFSSFVLIKSTHAQDAQSLLKKVFTLKSIPPHSGVKVGRYNKQGKTLVQSYEQVFLSPSRFKIHMTKPDSMKDDVFFADGKDLTYYIPRRKIKMVSPLSKAEFAPEDMFGANVVYSKILQNYIISIVKKETVLGLTCAVIKLVSRADAGMVRQMWVDTKSGLMVKDEHYTGGKFTASYSFEKISVKAPPASEIDVKMGFAAGIPGSDSADYKSLDAAKSKVAFEVRVPKFTPKGFFLEKVKVRNSLLGKEAVLFYTDGLVRFDITQRKTGLFNTLANVVLKLVEDYYLYSPVIKLEGEKEELQIIVAGELSENTLKKILTSL